jgi:DNA polymerase-3 subunit alpha
VLESLIKAGAMDCLPGKREELYSSIENVLKYGQSIQNNRSRNQVDIFGGEDGNSSMIREPKLYECEPWSEKQSLTFEKEVLGTYVSGHPLLKYADIIEKYATYDFTEAIPTTTKKSFRVGGMIDEINRSFDKKGREWARIKMECIGGMAEIIIFNEKFLRYKEIIHEGNIMFVSGNPENRSEMKNVKMLADHIVPIEQVENQLSKHLNILINPDSVSTKAIDELYKIAEQYHGDTRLVFHIQKNGRHQKILAHNISVSTDSAFFNKLKNIYGSKNIWIE